MITVTVELTREQANALLYFHRRVLAADIEKTIETRPKDFDAASDKLRVAIVKALANP